MKTLKELYEQRKTLKAEARDLIDTDFEKAQEKYQELEDLNEEIRTKEKEEEMRTAFNDDNEVEKRRNNPQNPDFTPEKDKKETSEMRAFRRYVEKREITGAIKTDDKFVVIPKEIVNEVQKYMEDEFSISNYVTDKTAKHLTGEMPVLRKGQVKPLPEVAELEANPDLGVQPFGMVEYKIKTHRGQMVISKETIEDSGIDSIKELTEWLGDMIIATRDYAVLKVLKDGALRGTETITFTEVPAVGVDGLKTIKNTALNTAFKNKMWFMNQNGYNELDLQKDGEGRYLLQSDITSPSGKSLFGYPVVEIPNTVLESTQENEYPMFFGDMKAAIVLFKRSEWLLQWTDYKHFGEALSPAVRQDVRINDEKSLVKVNFTLPTTP